MKKNWPLHASLIISLVVTFYSRRSTEVRKNNSNWNTFVKNSNLEISGHDTTEKELIIARVPSNSRSIAQVEDNNAKKTTHDKSYKNNHFLIRESRVLIGEIQKNDYQDENVPLEMINKINPNWKNILGKELLRFQPDDVKVMVKKEFSIIQIQNGSGRYVEQVIITYILKNGMINSYRALVDSETGIISETWDRSVHENSKNKQTTFTISSENQSGIIAR